MSLKSTSALSATFPALAKPALAKLDPPIAASLVATLTDLIFVYGTLVAKAAHPNGERLRREASLLGEATLQARLYRVSWYPGLVKSTESADLVYGEVYRLTSPATSLPWLDEYEGIIQSPASGAPPNEYERVTTSVALIAGGTVDAWVYLYLPATTALERVTSGRWIS